MPGEGFYVPVQSVPWCTLKRVPGEGLSVFHILCYSNSHTAMHRTASRKNLLSSIASFCACYVSVCLQFIALVCPRCIQFTVYCTGLHTFYGYSYCVVFIFAIRLHTLVLLLNYNFRTSQSRAKVNLIHDDWVSKNCLLVGALQSTARRGLNGLLLVFTRKY